MWVVFWIFWLVFCLFFWLFGWGFFEGVSLTGKIKLFCRVLLGWTYLCTLALSCSVSEKLREITVL